MLKLTILLHLLSLLLHMPTTAINNLYELLLTDLRPIHNYLLNLSLDPAGHLPELHNIVHYIATVFLVHYFV